MKRNRNAINLPLAFFVACAAPVIAHGATKAISGAEPVAIPSLAKESELERARIVWNQASAEAVQAHARTLATRGDPQSLLAAAMFWSVFQYRTDQTLQLPAQPAQESRVWFEAARAVQPRDALVAWVEANDCGLALGDACDQAGAIGFLLRTEPDNAAVHLMAMTAAERRGDRKSAERHWSAAASAGSYKLHMQELGVLFYTAMQEVRQPPMSSDLARALGEDFALNREATERDINSVNAMSLWIAIALPSFQPITSRCKPDVLRIGDALRQAQCERLLTLMAEDQSILISPMIALPIMVELTRGSSESQVWRERLREFYWIYENAMPVLSVKPTETALPADYLRWVMTEGELVGMQRLLALKGLPASPPDGWLPKEPSRRAKLAVQRDRPL